MGIDKDICLYKKQALTEMLVWVIKRINRNVGVSINTYW